MPSRGYVADSRALPRVLRLVRVGEAVAHVHVGVAADGDQPHLQRHHPRHIDPEVVVLALEHKPALCTAGRQVVVLQVALRPTLAPEEVLDDDEPLRDSDRLPAQHELLRLQPELVDRSVVEHIVQLRLPALAVAPLVRVALADLLQPVWDRPAREVLHVLEVIVALVRLHVLVCWQLDVRDRHERPLANVPARPALPGLHLVIPGHAL